MKYINLGNNLYYNEIYIGIFLGTGPARLCWDILVSTSALKSTWRNWDRLWQTTIRFSSETTRKRKNHFSSWLWEAILFPPPKFLTDLQRLLNYWTHQLLAMWLENESVSQQFPAIDNLLTLVNQVGFQEMNLLGKCHIQHQLQKDTTLWETLLKVQYLQTKICLDCFQNEMKLHAKIDVLYAWQSLFIKARWKMCCRIMQISKCYRDQQLIRVRKYLDEISTWRYSHRKCIFHL